MNQNGNIVKDTNNRLTINSLGSLNLSSLNNTGVIDNVVRQKYGPIITHGLSFDNLKIAGQPFGLNVIPGSEFLRFSMEYEKTTDTWEEFFEMDKFTHQDYINQLKVIYSGSNFESFNNPRRPIGDEYPLYKNLPGTIQTRSTNIIGKKVKLKYHYLLNGNTYYIESDPIVVVDKNQAAPPPPPPTVNNWVLDARFDAYNPGNYWEAYSEFSGREIRRGVSDNLAVMINERDPNYSSIINLLILHDFNFYNIGNGSRFITAQEANSMNIRNFRIQVSAYDTSWGSSINGDDSRLNWKNLYVSESIIHHLKSGTINNLDWVNKNSLLSSGNLYSLYELSDGFAGVDRTISELTGKRCVFPSLRFRVEPSNIDSGNIAIGYLFRIAIDYTDSGQNKTLYSNPTNATTSLYGGVKM